MGTRGAWGFVLDEKEYITYNHFDSYVEGLGLDLLAWAESVTSWRAIRDQVRALRLVDESDKPTEDDLRTFAASHDKRVSTGTDWYSLLRGNQGDAAATLRSGVMTDGHTFPLDSLFCEYAYVFDLDSDTFEVYKGFQKTLPTRGRWAGRPTAAEDAEAYEAHLAWCAENKRDPWRPETSEYKAVERIAAWPLSGLPSADELRALDAQYEDA